MPMPLVNLTFMNEVQEGQVNLNTSREGIKTGLNHPAWDWVGWCVSLEHRCLAGQIKMIVGDYGW